MIATARAGLGRFLRITVVHRLPGQRWGVASSGGSLNAVHFLPKLLRNAMGKPLKKLLPRLD